MSWLKVLQTLAILSVVAMFTTMIYIALTPPKLNGNCHNESIQRPASHRW
jgi:hypothetical protein